MLSKSKYLAGLQCPLRLRHQCFNPDLASPVSPTQQALFDTGHEVGQLATHLYPEGVLVETNPLCGLFSMAKVWAGRRKRRLKHMNPIQFR